MAMYVLLVFEEDTEAKAFVKGVLEGNVVGMLHKNDQYSVTNNFEGVAVRGVWKKPMIFCDSSDGHLIGKKKTDKGWTRGRKYGWWVCAVCHKPSKLWARGNAWYTALGTNLLPQSEAAPEYRPYGWTSPVEWADLLPLLNWNGPVEFRNDHTAKTAELIRRETT